MVDHKELLINAALTQIAQDVANKDFTALEELLGFHNEDVLYRYLQEDIRDGLLPE